MARNIPPGFMVYEESAKLLEVMPDEQAGRIAKAISHFYVTGELVTLKSDLEQAIFSSMADKVTRDAAKYSDICEKRKESAKKRWHK